MRRDHPALARLVLPIIERKFEDSRITNFSLIGVGREHVLGFEKRNGNGGGIIVHTAGQPIAGRTGLEVQASGALALWSMVPWYDGDRLIGYIELSEGIDHIIDEIHNILDVDIMLVTYKDFVDRERWELAASAGGGKAEWSRFKASVLINQTMRSVPQALGEILANNEHYVYDEVLRLQSRGRAQAASSFPLRRFPALPGCPCSSSFSSFLTGLNGNTNANARSKGSWQN